MTCKPVTILFTSCLLSPWRIGGKNHQRLRLVPLSWLKLSVISTSSECVTSQPSHTALFLIFTSGPILHPHRPFSFLFYFSAYDIFFYSPGRVLFEHFNVRLTLCISTCRPCLPTSPALWKESACRNPEVGKSLAVFIFNNRVSFVVRLSLDLNHTFIFFILTPRRFSDFGKELNFSGFTCKGTILKWQKGRMRFERTWKSLAMFAANCKSLEFSGRVQRYTRCIAVGLFIKCTWKELILICIFFVLPFFCRSPLLPCHLPLTAVSVE